MEGRGLLEESLSYFGVKTSVSQEDGQTVSAVFFPLFNGNKLLGFKARSLNEKVFWSVGDAKEADFFGWSQAIRTGAKRLYVTEGELDAIALYQILKQKNKGSKWEEFNPAVVSLRNGSSSAKRDISERIKEIKTHFKELVLVFDQDEPGQKATQEVTKLHPSVLTVDLPCKDANDCILEGRQKAAANALSFNAGTPDNTRLDRDWETQRDEA